MDKAQLQKSFDAVFADAGAHVRSGEAAAVEFSDLVLDQATFRGVPCEVEYIRSLSVGEPGDDGSLCTQMLMVTIGPREFGRAYGQEVRQVSFLWSDAAVAAEWLVDMAEMLREAKELMLRDEAFQREVALAEAAELRACLKPSVRGARHAL